MCPDEIEVVHKLILYLHTRQQSTQIRTGLSQRIYLGSRQSFWLSTKRNLLNLP